MGAELGIRGLQPWRRGPPLIGRCGSYSAICSCSLVICSSGSYSYSAICSCSLVICSVAAIGLSFAAIFLIVLMQLLLVLYLYWLFAICSYDLVLSISYLSLCCFFSLIILVSLSVLHSYISFIMGGRGRFSILNFVF